MPARCDRDAQLGADPVGRRHQHRVGISRRSEVEQTAEPANRGVRAGPCGGAGERPDRFDQPVGFVDVDAGVPVGRFVNRFLA